MKVNFFREIWQFKKKAIPLQSDIKVISYYNYKKLDYYYGRKQNKRVRVPWWLTQRISDVFNRSDPLGRCDNLFGIRHYRC